MCGITGIFRRSGLQSPDEEAIRHSLLKLAPRGPDDEDVARDGPVIFGHRRLAILDPASGRQPWRDGRTGLLLTYNGELFNYPDLRGNLESRGHVFTTSCDTEALVYAWLEWGEDCLHRLDGMFAFAVLDPRSARLVLVRDRLGVKPLYYSHRAGFMAFASSVGALLVHPDIEPVWDPMALAHYFLSIRTSLGSRTLVRDVDSLLPGELVSLSLATGESSRRIWWRLPAIPASEKAARDLTPELCDDLRDKFDAAVSRQLISDVPLGGFLSGGLDSSILTGAILSSRSAPFQAFSTGYQREGFNEWNFVQETASFHGIDCQVVRLDESEFLSDWRRLIAFKGLPLSTPNEVPISRLAAAFGKACTVAMTGEGADEIFGGYVGPTFCAYDYDRSRGLAGGISPEALLRAYGTSDLGTRREHFFRVNAWLSPGRQAELFPGLANGADSPLSRVHGWYDDLFKTFDCCSTFDAYLHVHARVNLEGLLNRLDSSTMSASVEGRVPYTDHRLAEWAFSLPDSLKMRLRPAFDGIGFRNYNIYDLQAANAIESKRLLRAAFADRVPQTVLNRAKVSFPVPFLEWFTGPLRASAKEILRQSVLVESFLDPGQWRRELDGPGELDGMLAWPLLNLSLMEAEWGMRL